jgi:hypothetical protein
MGKIKLLTINERERLVDSSNHREILMNNNKSKNGK